MTAKRKSIKISKISPKIREFMLMGVKLSLASSIDIKRVVFDAINQHKQYQISTPNPEQIVLAQENEVFAKVLNNSVINLPDGIGLIWALKKQGINPDNYAYERISGMDFMLDLCEQAGRKGMRVFLLGGSPNSALIASQKLKAKYPGLQINYDAGAKNIKSEKKAERERIISKINFFKPHILLVAYGAPYQEIWISKYLKKLKCNIAMCVGGAFDYISGQVKRAPAWARRAGLEWFFRLIYQPWRIWRQLKLFKFVVLVFADK